MANGGCDKCGKEVSPENDATLVQAYLSGNGAVAFFAIPRHFLPTADCTGSPSRAQYIQGQPRDDRGYPYRSEMEQRWRKAYVDLQADVAAGKFK